MGVTDELVSEEIEAWLVAPSLSSVSDEPCVEGTSETFVMDVGETILAASVVFGFVVADRERRDSKSASIWDRILAFGSSDLGFSNTSFASCWLRFRI